MDDIILNHFLTIMARQAIEQQLLRNVAITISSCDICSNQFQEQNLLSCVFCSKDFCSSCCGKEGTKICAQCNFGLAIGVNYKVLNNFSIKELKVISDNYRIPLEGIVEKADLINALLKNFKKSIKACNESLVDVEDLRIKMSQMNTDEMKTKERNLQKEKENEKIFNNFENVDNHEEELLPNFTDVGINVNVEDIPNLSIKEIKFILDAFNVDYSFAIEKKELVNLAIRLAEAYKKFQKINSNEKKEIEIEETEVGISEIKNYYENQNNTKKDKFECVICMDQLISSVFLNCAHSNCCYECALTQQNCPICREDVVKCVKIYFG